jgi:hypothetical protein
MAVKRTAIKNPFQEVVDEYKKLQDFDYVTPLQAFLDKPISESDRDLMQKSFVKGLSQRFGPKSDFSVQLAFEAAGLDPRDPLALEVLLRLFAMAYFPSRQKTRGAKPKWTPERWSQLLSDYDQVKTEKPRLKDKQLCQTVVKRFPSRYPKPAPHSARRPAEDPGATVRRNLAHAKDPAKNTQLAELAQIYADLMKTEIQKINPNIDFPVQKLNERSISVATDWLSKAWKRERKLVN